MTKNEDEFTPRDYQLDLYEKAVKGNVILYLPTGAGKTYIAIMLIKNLSADIRKPWDEGGKRTIFTVNTVALTNQQRAYISRHTDLTCSEYSGEMNVDLWKKERWIEEFKKNQVLVMTSQILLDLMNHSHLPLTRINLIIFDECHHGVGDHPMRQIMKMWENYGKNEHPKILGLSATLLNCNVKPCQAIVPIRKLEMTFHAKIISVDCYAAVSGYGKPSEKKIIYNSPVESPIFKEISEMTQYAIEILSTIDIKESVVNESSEEFQPKKKTVKLKNIFEEIQIHISTLGLYVGNLGILHHLVQIEKLKNSVDDAESLTLLDYLKTFMMTMQKMIDNEMTESTEIENMMKYSSDKAIKLFNVLKVAFDELKKKSFGEMSSTDQKFCCIIFVHRRFTAKILYHVLKKLSELHKDFKFLLPEYVLGNSSNPFKSPVESMCLARWNAEALMKFRTGVANCLIATQVLEEGVDIPQCSLVINFDAPPDFRSYVQGRGRARYENSKFIIFVDSKDDKFDVRYSEYQNVEAILKNHFVGNTVERSEPLPEEIKNFLYNHEILPYVVTNEMGVISQITEISAIPLINKYCAKLAQSKFASIVPVYKLHKINESSEDNKAEGKFIVSIRLPLLSPLRGIIYGDVMSSIVSAKRSAAMAVCKKLHEIGELTDRLLPQETNEVIEDITSFLKYWQDESPENKKKVGETNYKRFYDLIYPEILNGAFPSPEEDVYLHIIDAIPTYSPPMDNRNRVFYNLLKSSSGYAILSSKKFPKLPEFPLYMKLGEVNVKLRVNFKCLKLSSIEIHELRRFHWIIFRDVLDLIKGFMIYDCANMENSFLIVPVDEKWELNWSVVRQYTSVEKVITPNNFQKAITDGSDQESMDNFFNWELVSPNYRTATNIYVVTKVCNDLNPESTFPTDDYICYTHYFAGKHKLEISDKTQPLLEVKPISDKLNFIIKKAPISLNKRKRENLEEHLVPELCCKIIFPALYYLKSRILPSILHRVTQLLIAEDLRQQIATEAGLGSISVSTENNDDDHWETLHLSSDNDESSSDNEESTSDNDESDESSTQLEDMISDKSKVDNAKIEPKVIESEIDILSLNKNVNLWEKEKEPRDLERNIDNVKLMDIEYYNIFTNSVHIFNEEFKKCITKTIIKAPSLGILDKITERGPSAAEILSAITSKTAHDSINLERLETLGDSFLKFIISLYLFEQYPCQTEGRLTGFKGKIIGNRYLYYCGVNKRIPGRLKVEEFVPKSNFIVPSYSAPREIQEFIRSSNKAPNVLYEVTIPPAEQFSGSLSDETKCEFDEKIDSWVNATLPIGVEQFIRIQSVADKTVADSVEALTGIYLKSMGLSGAAKLLQWFGVLPDQADIQKILMGCPMGAALGDGNANSFMPWAEYIQNIIGYKFKDSAFLLQAFTHASYSPNRITLSYDRLEFLGDAIIDFLITAYIYENCGKLSPGELTDLRSALVNNITFACLTVKYKLHTALLAYSPTLFGSIERFVRFQEERNNVIDDELLWILLEENDCDMAEYVDVPKVLGDLFESVIGAIYLDSGKDLNKVWSILYSFMHNEINQFSKNVPKQAIRVLYETPGTCPKFSKSEILKDSGRIMVTLQVQVLGKQKHFHGFGFTKKQAKVGAAKRALKSLQQNR